MPLMLKEELDIQAQAFLKELHSYAGVVNTAITMAATEGNCDSNLLAKTGGNIVIGQNISLLVWDLSKGESLQRLNCW